MSTKRNLVNELLKRNCLITPDCYEILEDVDDDTIDLDRLANALKNELVVTAEKLQEALQSFEEFLSEGDILESNFITDESLEQSEMDITLPSKKVEEPLDSIPDSSKDDEKILATQIRDISKDVPSQFDPIGRNIDTQFKILHESSGQTTIDGTLKDFSKYFISRFKQLSAILKKRGDIGGSFRIGDLKKAKIDEHERIGILGMVTTKVSLKNGGMLFEVEDPTGSITITISNKMQELLVKAGALLQDQVAGFFGKIYGDRMVLEDFVFPDLPLSSRSKTVKDPVSVCMTSDLHIGSKEFLEDSFNNLIDFLNGRVDDPYQQTLASQVKYLIVGGDVVEGIGIYPKQEDDLIITDIYGQYDKAAELLAKIPDWIHIIIISGNHDACRLALPQPAIGKEYAPKLWAMKNVSMLSNPSTVNIHGKVFLLYHGNSFEDVSSLTPGLSMSDANGPMIYTLRYRHLAPTFGRRSSVVPSLKDELVIEHVPDVYHTGHIHINAHTRYRGVDCINSGTFQSQTDYMQSKNINPTPGRVPIINLQSGKLYELVFYDPKEQKQ